MLASPSRRLAVAALLTLWVAALLLTRMVLTGSAFGLFLVWNLFLAAVPLMASTALVALDRKGGRLGGRLALAAVWLLFLPNAPYILTDLVHLESTLLDLGWSVASGAGVEAARASLRASA